MITLILLSEYWSALIKMQIIRIGGGRARSHWWPADQWTKSVIHPYPRHNGATVILVYTLDEYFIYLIALDYPLLCQVINWGTVYCVVEAIHMEGAWWRASKIIMKTSTVLNEWVIFYVAPNPRLKVLAIDIDLKIEYCTFWCLKEHAPGVQPARYMYVRSVRTRCEILIWDGVALQCPLALSPRWYEVIGSDGCQICPR